MYNFKNQIIAYANVKNKNNCIISRKELKKCVQTKHVPIFDNYDFTKLIGTTINVRLEKNRLIIDGFLIKKINLKNKCFRFAIFANREFKKNGNTYILKDCTLDSIGLIDKINDAYNMKGEKMAKKRVKAKGKKKAKAKRR